MLTSCVKLRRLFVNAFTSCPPRIASPAFEMKKVAESTVGRLSVYLRVLMEIEEDGVATISSDELARRAGTTAAQVRKDLSFFGTFGKRGLGYAVPELVAELRRILGLGRSWRVALVGAGKIGQALYGYQDFRRQGFHIEAVFDADPAKIGQRLDGVEVLSEQELERELRARAIEIVIIAVPASAAQGLVDRAVRAGVRGILNFAPVQLRVPPGVALKHVNMAVEMEGLSYALANGGRRRRGSPSASGRQ
ncbi:MAG TPA: redox-sensing transcriptional repressor Rex [Longimicrobiales bacterium]